MQPDLRNTHLYDSALPWLQNSGGASVSSAQATKGGEHSFAATLAAQHPTDTPSTTGTSQVSASKPHIVISPEPPAATPNGKTYVGEDGLNFWDVVDVINPLQHIPVISHLYRQFTGDNISKGAQILGDTLFGGVIGLAASLVGQVLVHQSG